MYIQLAAGRMLRKEDHHVMKAELDNKEHDKIIHKHDGSTQVTG
jgi:hypothetical protein